MQLKDTRGRGGSGTIRVRRELGETDHMRAYTVFLNGVQVAELPAGSSKDLPVSPGLNTVQLKLDTETSREFWIGVQESHTYDLVARPKATPRLRLLDALGAWRHRIDLQLDDGLVSGRDSDDVASGPGRPPLPGSRLRSMAAAIGTGVLAFFSLEFALGVIGDLIRVVLGGALPGWFVYVGVALVPLMSVVSVLAGRTAYIERRKGVSTPHNVYFSPHAELASRADWPSDRGKTSKSWYLAVIGELILITGSFVVPLAITGSILISILTVAGVLVVAYMVVLPILAIRWARREAPYRTDWDGTSHHRSQASDT